VSELERSLRALGGEIAYPPTPAFELDLGRRGARARPRPLALGLAVALAVLAGVLALSPAARSAFLEILHLKGATVELVETLPPVHVQAPEFGERVSRAEAERRVGFHLLDVGEPDAVFVLGGRMATLVYGRVERPRLVLSQLNGSVWDGLAKKVAGRGTRVESVTVAGENGLFLSGDEHHAMFLDEQGNVADEPTFLAGTVLLWNHGDLLLRLEGELTKAEALRLARSAD
jgi:hypothetical protein